MSFTAKAQTFLFFTGDPSTHRAYKHRSRAFLERTGRTEGTAVISSLFSPYKTLTKQQQLLLFNQMDCSEPALYLFLRCLIAAYFQL